MTARRRKTHGLSESRTYRIWNLMKRRCLNPRDKDFRYYGGRGVSVCDRWLSFENFVLDMGEAPDGLTIDRFPDGNGPYQPGNCRWASMKEQNRNRSVNVMLTHEGKTQCLSAWAEEFGVPYKQFQLFIKKGLSLPEAAKKACIPPRKKNQNAFKGVKKSLNKWIARVVVDGKRLHLGTFETAEAAAAAYQAHKESPKNLAEA